jgi:hypothetical protein
MRRKKVKEAEEIARLVEAVCDSVKTTLLSRLQAENSGKFSGVFARQVPTTTNLECLIDHDLNKIVQGRLPAGGMQEAVFDLICKLTLYSAALTRIVKCQFEVALPGKEDRKKAAQDVLDALGKKVADDIQTAEDKACIGRIFPTLKKRSARKDRAKTPKKQ